MVRFCFAIEFEQMKHMAHNIHIWMLLKWIFFCLTAMHPPLMWSDKIYNAEFIDNLVSENEVCQAFHMKFITWKIRFDDSDNFTVLQSAKYRKYRK